MRPSASADTHCTVIGMSACLQLGEPGCARVRRWCLQCVSRACPGRVGGGVRGLPAAADGRRAPTAPGASALGGEWTGSRPPRPRYTRATRDWVPCWRDCHLCFACMTSLSHHRAVGGLPREIDRPDRGLLGTGPSRLRRPHSAGT